MAFPHTEYINGENEGVEIVDIYTNYETSIMSPTINYR